MRAFVVVVWAVAAGGAPIVGCTPQTVRARWAPPAQRIEVTPPSPGPEFVWTPGYWRMDASREVWLWRPGQYARRPKGAVAWRRGRWVQKGHRWKWIAGGWSYRASSDARP
jgi:hypothetical protein